MISTHLWEVDKQRVLQIPIGTATSRDRLIWHFSKNGTFSISTCYHMIFADSHCTLPVESGNVGQGSNSNHLNWNLVWGMNVPPKVRMFVWRATLNTLPHKAKLFRRRIATSPSCDRCSREVETTEHIFQYCRKMEQIWKEPHFSLQQREEKLSFWAWQT